MWVSGHKRTASTFVVEAVLRSKYLSIGLLFSQKKNQITKLEILSLHMREGSEAVHEPIGELEYILRILYNYKMSGKVVLALLYFYKNARQSVLMVLYFYKTVRRIRFDLLYNYKV